MNNIKVNVELNLSIFTILCKIGKRNKLNMLSQVFPVTIVALVLTNIKCSESSILIGIIFSKNFFMKKDRFGGNRHLTLQINISCLTQTPF